MAPKKKPNQKEGEVDPFDVFLKKYQQNLKDFDAPRIPDVQDYISKIQDDGENVVSWNFTREFDPMGFRIFFHSMTQAKYVNIEAIRIWKCNGGDESVRSVCYYLDSDPVPQVKDLQFTDNGVTALGCEFLGKILGPNGNKVVNLLRLDYNQFGTPGIEKLSLGLSQNACLRHLSLQYCGITEDGGQYIAHILMFVQNAIEILDLRGNYLRDQGVVEVFHGARRSKSLNQIDVFDNKFSDTPEIIDALRDLFENNKTLCRYNLGGNQIGDAGASKLINGMIGHSHLVEVKVSERCSMKTFEALEFQLNAAKGKKKGKRKK